MSTVMENPELKEEEPQQAAATIDPGVQQQFIDFGQSVDQSMVERGDEIHLILAALLCNEHVCLVGPPGTGKSQLANIMAQWLDGSMFAWLLNKFTMPEELYGPVSIQGLKHDEYRRITAAKASEADVLFLDEIFKSNPGILNTLLTLLNERVYFNGGVPVQCPLKLCIGCSNEWPGGEGQELSALFDRFLLRKVVRPIANTMKLETMLFGSLPAPNVAPLSLSDLETAQRNVESIPWTDAAKTAFWQIVRQCKSEGVMTGDRRLKKSVLACRASAYLAGHSEVESDDLLILRHALWVDPAEQPDHVAAIVAEIAAPETIEVNKYLAEAEETFEHINPNDLGTLTGAVKKLDEIQRKTESLKGDRAASAAEHVKSLQRQVRELILKEADRQ